MPRRSSVSQMAVDDGCGDQFGHSRSFAVALFDFLQGVRAEFEARFVFREKLRDASVEIPAEVVESRRGSEGAHVVK